MGLSGGESSVSNDPMNFEKHRLRFLVIVLRILVS